jgi:hypothetical protein
MINSIIVEGAMLLSLTPPASFLRSLTVASSGRFLCLLCDLYSTRFISLVCALEGSMIRKQPSKLP